jgi:uncharacterized protein YjiS (DUF1127 family)
MKFWRSDQLVTEKRQTVFVVTSFLPRCTYIPNLCSCRNMESAMSTITMTTYRTTRSSYWDQLKLRITEWQRRARSRRELEGLSDATLRDIGMTRCDAHREMNKPFWMA